MVLLYDDVMTGIYEMVLGIYGFTHCEEREALFRGYKTYRKNMDNVISTGNRFTTAVLTRKGLVKKTTRMMLLALKQRVKSK